MERGDMEWNRKGNLNLVDYNWLPQLGLQERTENLMTTRVITL